MKKRIAVLISNAGTGTNLQAIIDRIESGKINAEIAVVISDKEDAFGLKRAKENNIPTEINHDKEDLLELLKKFMIDYVCLTGWKQIITDTLIDSFKILNVHPGLIPDVQDSVVKNPDGTNALWNRGKFTSVAIQNFIDQKSTFAGSTIHFLSHEFDFGSVLGRCFEKIQSEDTVESLYSRLKVKENKLYADVLERLCGE